MDRYFGIFETVRVENGAPVLLRYHFERILKSSRCLGIPFSLDEESFGELLLNHAKYPVSLVRFTLYRDGSTEVTVRPCEKREKVHLIPVRSVKRCYSGLSLHKTIDIMDSILALETAKKAGGDEALLFSPDGFISETAFANIFFVKDGVFYTPSLKTGCLPGTRRAFILELLKTMGVPCIEGFFTLRELLQADEVFITSAREDAVPVLKIGNRELKKVTGKRWADRIKDIIRERFYLTL
ncbi:aminotransferase class IV [Phorcysia thermohydrogeniphila]|uniref:branched-chain-amino-acid transaminase n=1 Tax=Phorcysia thermohydrogeniphila TaxID=936138 RepID=A0A4R1GP91_9BACT|nr:aminotransferase class IV [Phorcysia thermohydrogeniphila]TCK06272.1 branched-chain amino acid aminotransferase/4-amino-4-deoxychorismate lyase [Phorcysia thermohydrogeniphila]